MPQCSLLPGPSFLPVPSALVTIRSPGREPRVHAVGWLGVVCDSPPLLTVWLRAGADDQEPLRAGDPFAVSLPGEELLQVLAGRTEQAGPASSVRPARSPIAVEGLERALPAACPVQLECRCRSLTVRFGQHRVCGEVLAISLDGHRHELTAAVDFCRLAPFQRRRFQGHGAGLARRDAS